MPVLRSLVSTESNRFATSNQNVVCFDSRHLTAVIHSICLINTDKQMGRERERESHRMNANEQELQSSLEKVMLVVLWCEYNEPLNNWRFDALRENVDNSSACDDNGCPNICKLIQLSAVRLLHNLYIQPADYCSLYGTAVGNES